MADFNDFGLILQDFERPFGRNQLVLALQFSFKTLLRLVLELNVSYNKGMCEVTVHFYFKIFNAFYHAENLHLI